MHAHSTHEETRERVRIQRSKKGGGVTVVFKTNSRKDEHFVGARLAVDGGGARARTVVERRDSGTLGQTLAVRQESIAAG